MGGTTLWLPLASGAIAVLGTLGGVVITQVFASRREDKSWARTREAERENQWIVDRRTYYRPLREAAYDLTTRLEYLGRIYRQEFPEAAPFRPDSLSRDFRELYALSPDPIENLYGADANEPRRNDQAVQRLRTRMCRELNFATSSVYRAARFLAWADVNRTLLERGHTSLPRQPAQLLLDQLAAVSRAWQGPTGAGLSAEQQESIGEMMLTSEGRVITQFEFRQRLLELPGWEQYTALLTFFITEDDDVQRRPFAARFAAKVDYEVLETIIALDALVASLDELPAVDQPPSDWRIEPQQRPRPW
jgi:hypothetical protein